MSDAVALEVNHLSKTYGDGSNALTVLDDVSFAIAAGTTCSIAVPTVVRYSVMAPDGAPLHPIQIKAEINKVADIFFVNIIYEY